MEDDHRLGDEESEERGHSALALGYTPRVLPSLIKPGMPAIDSFFAVQINATHPTR